MELLLLFSKTMTKAFFLSLSNLEHSSDEVATQMFWVNPSGKQYSPYQRYQSSLPNAPQNMATPQRGCSLKYLNLKIIQHKGTLGQVIEAGLGQVREAASACSFSSLFSIGDRTAAFFPLCSAWVFYFSSPEPFSFLRISFRVGSLKTS